VFWLVENNKQLQYFIDVNKNKDISEVFVEVVQSNDLYHPALTTPCLFYVRPIGYKKGFMFPINHNDTFSVDLKLLKALFDSFDTVYVRDKKATLYHFKHHNIQDLNFISNIEKLDFNTPVHQHFYQKYGDRNDINKIIPIVKHYERCELIYDKIKPVLFMDKPPHFHFYNNNVAPVFYMIEKNGMGIDKHDLDKFYEILHESYSISDDKIFTQYNLYTTTRRPSNSFNSVNFAALNKDSGARKSFIAQNDYLVEFDISSYHPTLANKLMGGDFDISQLYEQVGKENVFRQLYGGIQEQYLDIPFFAKCKEYIDDNWKTYNNSGKVIVPLSGYCLENIDNPNPYKLFNYILQNYETSLNINILRKIIELLKGKQTKPILYVYDSILLDYAQADGEELLTDIHNIFTQQGLTVKTQHGANYNNLRPL
jgi:hypothetical protein